MTQKSRRSIVLLGDLHGAYRGVARIVHDLQNSPPDLILLVGDLGSDLLWHGQNDPADRVARWQASIDRITRALEPLGVPVALVPGNHDRANPSLPEHCHNIDGRLAQFAGLTLGGIGGAGPKPFGLPYEWSEAQLTAHLERLAWTPDGLDVLLCHAPPKSSGLDRTQGGVEAGSTTLAKLIESLRPPLFVCGHIHEAAGHRVFGRTLAVNAGRMIWAKSYDRYGRPAPGAPTAFQYFRVDLEEKIPRRLSQVLLACRGEVRVLQSESWSLEPSKP